MTPLPENFLIMLEDLLGSEAKDLIKALEEPPVTSIRINKRKSGVEFSEMEPVKWCESGYYLKERPEFILDPLLHAGAYYVQDASSMIYETVVSRLLKKFRSSEDTASFLTAISLSDITSRLKVLDLCAAPGGKTTAMINALPDGTEIVANEYSSKRLAALKENIERWGYPEVTITNKDTSFYAKEEEEYDIVAVDAPCSGEGMMRKEEIARTQWSPQLISQCSTLQKEILRNAEKTLKPGGFLIYSTCTFNRNENEENAEFIKEELGLTPIDLDFPEEWGISRGILTDLPVYRFMPHKTRGEGLFLAVFQKPGDWKPSIRKPLKNLIPKETKDYYPLVDVDKETALKYLRRESIVLTPDAPKGMVTISYKGLPLGPAKNIGSRANNLYPKNRRILKR